jgi:hypothetical protein
MDIQVSKEIEQMIISQELPYEKVLILQGKNNTGYIELRFRQDVDRRFYIRYNDNVMFYNNGMRDLTSIEEESIRHLKKIIVHLQHEYGKAGHKIALSFDDTIEFDHKIMLNSDKQTLYGLQCVNTS